MSWREILTNSNTGNQEHKENQNRQKSNIPDIPYFLGSEELKNEILEQAKYLFFERLGMSDNEELAFDGAIDYINSQLTNRQNEQ
jgi:hypothetical protein